MPRASLTHFGSHNIALPSRIYADFTRIPTGYALDLDANAYALSGQALELRIEPQAGAFSLAGQDSELYYSPHRTVAHFADHDIFGPSRIYGTFSRSVAYAADLDADAFTLAGQLNAFSQEITLVSNGFTISGNALAESQLEDLVAGSYSLTTPDALLTKANVYDLTLESTSYSLTGQLTTNSIGAIVLAENYALAGQILAEDQLKDFASGNLTLNGQATTLVKVSISEMLLDVGDYTLSGQATVNDQQRNLIGSSYAYAGQTLAQSQLEDLASANYALSGGTLIKASTALLAPNVFFLNGNPSSKYIYAPLDPQAFTLSGQTITLNYVLGRDVSPLTDHISFGLPMRIHGTFGRITAAKTLTLDAATFALAGGALGGRPGSNFSMHGVMGMPSRIPGDFYKAKILQIALDSSAFTLVTDGYYAILHDEVGNVIIDPTTGLPIQVWVDTTTQLLTGTTTDHPLTLNAGSFSLSGQTLTCARVQSNAAGSYLLTGQAAELPRPIVNLDGAQYTLSGQPATIQKVFPTLTLAAANYAVSGQAELFERRNSNLAGSYALSGQSAVFSAWNLVLAAGDFALVGDETSLQKIGQYGTDLTAGSYALAGQNTALNLDRIAESTTYSYTGEAANLDRLDLTLAAQSFSLTGQNALIYKVGVYSLDLDGYDFTLTGNDQDYLYSRSMFLGANGYVLISPDEQEGLITRDIDLDYADYFYSGHNATLATAADFPFDADAGGYGLNGDDADLLTLEKAITLSGGHYTLTGGVATLLATVVKIKLTTRLASGTFRLRGKIQGEKVNKLRVKTDVDLKSDVFDSS